LAFVTAVYQDLFQRAPDALGLATWARLLLQGTPYGEVAKAITYSDEYRSRLIRETYQHYLGRGADPSGLAFWLQQMRAGRHIEEIQAGFIASDEYYLKYGATPSGWVTGLYQSVLGRTPAADEVRWWVNAMRAGLTRGDVARGFLYSTEHLTTVVDGYYTTLLDRHIDPSGQATWVRLIQAGHRDEEIIASVVSSAEYRHKNAPVPPPPDTFLVGPTGNASTASNWTLSHDGRWVVFDTWAEELVGAGGYRTDVYLWDRTTSVRTRLSQAPDGSAANGRSEHPTISADGRWVAFASNASDLVSGDTNGGWDIFVWDRTTGELSLLGLTGPGVGGYYSGPSISADGRWITYVRLGNTAEVYVADRLDGTTRAVSAAAGGFPVNGNADSPAISGDGRWVLFRTMVQRADVDWPHDTKVFLWDRENGTTTPVSVPDDTPFEVISGPVISADGRWISYAAVVSVAEPLGDIDVFVVDRTTGERTSVPTPDPAGRWEGDRLLTPSLSADGSWVAFISGENLGVLGRASGATSLAPRGYPGYFGAFFQRPVMSGDGQWILFQSSASDLVEGDTNEDVDLFVTRNPLAQP
jgi:Tol biopolymer transport system component